MSQYHNSIGITVANDETDHSVTLVLIITSDLSCQLCIHTTIMQSKSKVYMTLRKSCSAFDSSS